MSQPALETVNFELAARARRLIKSFYRGGPNLDLKGHFRDGADWYGNEAAVDPERRLQRILNEIHWSSPDVEDLLRLLIEAIEKEEQLSEPVALPSSFYQPGHLQCPCCGKDLILGFDGKQFSILSERCPYPDGLVSEWELNVPSGKLVITNDLRRWFPCDDNYDVNTFYGCHLTALAYAEVGMAHGFVGNSSPSVYRKGKKGFVLGTYYPEVWDQETREYYPNPNPCPWGESVASVVTDLWWYSIVDYDELVRRWEYYTPNRSLEEFLSLWHVFVVDVPPGVYKFRHPAPLRRDKPITEYASFQWVRPADPLRDYLAEEKARHMTATELLFQHLLTRIKWRELKDFDSDSLQGAIEKWEEFDERKQATMLASAADAFLFSMRGDEWHRNGFPRGTISDEVKTFAAEYGSLPSFDFPVAWRPLSKRHTICRAAGVGEDPYAEGSVPDLEPSFVLLALNICQSAIQHGPKIEIPPNIEWKPEQRRAAENRAREDMLVLGEVYAALRKKRPEIVFDEEFDQWIGKTDLRAYVDMVDLHIEPMLEW